MHKAEPSSKIGARPATAPSRSRLGLEFRSVNRGPDREKLRINTRNRPSRCVGGCAGIRWARRTRPRASGETSIEAFFPFFAHSDFFSASEGGVASKYDTVLVKQHTK